jgi:hypothetical protein
VLATAELIAVLDLKGTIDLLPPGVAATVAGIITGAALVVHFGKALLGGLNKAGETE